MSITDELREFIETHLYLGATSLGGWKEAAFAIADRIDEEHFNALVGRSEIGVQAVLSDPEQYGLVALPRDADGEVIHIGDVMEWIDLDGETLTVKGIGNGMLFYIDCGSVKWTVARNKRHYHEPTVEDLLFSYGQACIRTSNEAETDAAKQTMLARLREDYATKLRLAGSDAE